MRIKLASRTPKTTPSRVTESPTRSWRMSDWVNGVLKQYSAIALRFAGDFLAGQNERERAFVGSAIREKVAAVGRQHIETRKLFAQRHDRAVCQIAVVELFHDASHGGSIMRETNSN